MNPTADPTMTPAQPGYGVQPAQPGMGAAATTTANRSPAVELALQEVTVDPGPVGSISAAEPATDFVAMAGSSNLFEIASSQLALQRSQDPQIRQFAQQMIEDHQVALEGLRQVVSNVEGIDLNRVGGIDPKHREMLDVLQQAQGDDFDRLYIFYQTRAHKNAVELFQNYAWNGDNEQLRQLAVAATPLLRQHHEMALAMPGAGAVS